MTGKMAAILQNAPEGLGKTVDYINLLPEDLLAELCHEIAQFIQGNTASVSLNTYIQKLLASDVDLNSEKLQSVVNAISFIYRQANDEKLDSGSLEEQLRQGLILTKAHLSVIAHVWDEWGQAASDSNSALCLNVGQLTDMKWRFAVAVSSDSCRTLNNPHVMMQLTVVNPAGEQNDHTFEMTIPEFQNFSKQIKDMATVLETV